MDQNEVIFIYILKNTCYYYLSFYALIPHELTSLLSTICNDVRKILIIFALLLKIIFFNNLQWLVKLLLEFTKIVYKAQFYIIKN